MKIVYRVVCAVLALAAIPIALFQPLIRIVFSPMKTYVEEKVSIKRALDLFTGDGPLANFVKGSDNFQMSDTLRSLLPALIATGVLIAVALLITLVIFFFACFSNKKIVITSLALVGLFAMIGAFIAFGRFATPLTDGSVNIGDLVDLSTIGSIASMLISLVVVQLSSAAFLLIVIFVLIIVWGLSFILTEIGEEKKPQRKIK